MAQGLNVRAEMRGRRKPNFLLIVVPDVNSHMLQSQLQADQSPFDKPGLLVRKLNMCTGDLIYATDCASRVLFDFFVAHCMTMQEGQKRGPPHSCSLLWMQELKTSKTILFHHRLLNSKLLLSDRNVQDTMVEPGYYQNAMALVRHYGKPTFFITMTLDESRDLFGGQTMKYITQYHVLRGA